MAEGIRRLAAIMLTDLVGYTALMGADETRAIAVAERSRELIATRVAAHGGRCVEHEGDGTLSTFPSAVEAAGCAAEIRAAVSREGIALRIGLHVGDVIDSGGRIVGDGVNVTARICALAGAGEIYVSEAVYDQIRNQPGLAARRIGAPRLKNVSRPIPVWSIETLGEAARDHRPYRRLRRTAARSIGGALLAAILVLTARPDLRNALVARMIGIFPSVIAPRLDREIGFARSADGTRIAYASVGKGQPIVQVQAWATHVEYGPLAPPDRLRSILANHRIVYYDGRGFGLSERGVLHGLERQVQDLEAVVEAARLDRFALWGISGGSAAAIEFTVRHPQRVSHLILYGTMLRQPLDDESFSATLALIRNHWGSREPAFRNYFQSLFAPDATDLQMRVFEEVCAIVAKRDDVAAFWESSRGLDETETARKVRVPTLVLHRRGDVLVPFEMGLEVASLIPGARFVALERRNHVFLPGDEEGDRAFAEMEAFVSETGGTLVPAAGAPLVR